MASDFTVKCKKPVCCCLVDNFPLFRRDIDSGRNSPPIEDILNEILENDSYDPSLIEKEFNDDEDFFSVDIKVKDNEPTNLFSSQASITDPSTASLPTFSKSTVREPDPVVQTKHVEPIKTPTMAVATVRPLENVQKKIICLKPQVSKEVKTIPMIRAAKPGPMAQSGNLITLTSNDESDSGQKDSKKRKIKRDLVPNPVLKYPKYRANIPESLDQVELDEDGKERIDKFILKKKPVRERLGHKDKSDGERNYKDSDRNFKESDRSQKIGDRIGHKSENKRRKSSEESEIRKIEVISGRGEVTTKPGLLPNPIFDGSSPVKIHVNPKFAEKLQQNQLLQQQQQQQMLFNQVQNMNAVQGINALLSTSLIMSQPQFLKFSHCFSSKLTTTTSTISLIIKHSLTHLLETLPI